jgi:hypothetical protein
MNHALTSQHGHIWLCDSAEELAGIKQPMARSIRGLIERGIVIKELTHGHDWSPAIKIGGLSAAATPSRPSCRFGISLSPKGAIHHSPGQRPGIREESAQCLRPEGARQLKLMPQSLSKLYVHLVFSTGKMVMAAFR